MIRLLLADDHTLVREGLKQLFADTADIVVTAEAEDGPSIMERLRAGGCDVVVLDISMPGRSGVDMIGQIRAETPRVKILVLSMHSESQYAVHALRAGASGYMTKDSRPDELIEAVRRVAEGRRYITPSLAETIANALDADFQAPAHERLSGRELEVLLMLGSGMSLTEMATSLHLSVKTVSTYRTRLLRKLGMENNAQLIRYAVANGLLD